MIRPSEVGVRSEGGLGALDPTRARAVVFKWNSRVARFFFRSGRQGAVRERPYPRVGDLLDPNLRLDDLHSAVLHVVIRLKICANLDGLGASIRRLELKSAEIGISGRISC
jgi:hypothetical protein